VSVNWTLPFDEKLIPKSLRVISPQSYKEIHRASVDNYVRFWEGIASELEWFKPWNKALDDSNPPFYKWFVGGELNISYLSVDRHANSWRRNKVAIIWEGEATEGERPKERRMITYAELHREVNRIAYTLREVYGIDKQSRVLIYLPMIPELPFFMLALARLGSPFSVVFSGFSAEALVDRINDFAPRLLVTADGGVRRGKVIDLKGIVDKALEKSNNVKDVIVVERLGKGANMKEGRDRYFADVMREVPLRAQVDPVKVKSEDPLYVLYTSGTTGKPKGIVHDNGGYATLLHSTMNWVFDLTDKDVYWCTADIGWVTGHSYIVFGPLIEGATTVIYEGALDFPSPDRWASIIERHGVTILYTSPTAIRSFMRYGEKAYKGRDLSSVRLVHSVGEPINPAAFNWFRSLFGDIPFGSTWWMTETGGILISHTPGLYMIPMKPGTNGMPILGVDAEVVDDEGKPALTGTRGYLVLRKPWPGMPLTIQGDPERYVKVYWSRFPGYFYTGDYAVRDQDDYIWVLGRADEVIKVAGHRLGTYELESALIKHPAVAEAAVVGIPDEIRGEVPVAFVTLKSHNVPSRELAEQLKAWARDMVGPIAVIKDVYFVTKLPKTRSGKIMRRVVKAVAIGGNVGDVTTLEDEASVDEVKRAIEELMKETERFGKS